MSHQGLRRQEADAVHLFGEGKRMTRSWGMNYDFATGWLELTDPVPAWLMSVRASAADLAGLPAVDLVQAMVTRYGPGAGIGGHRDLPVYEHVVGVSLVAPVTMRFRRPVGTRSNARPPA